jgi:hypothetical protein
MNVGGTTGYITFIWSPDLYVTHRVFLVKTFF